MNTGSKRKVQSKRAMVMSKSELVQNTMTVVLPERLLSGIYRTIGRNWNFHP